MIKERKPRAADTRLSKVRPVRAVLFDLDGTLIDSEVHTDAAVSAVAAGYRIAGFTLPHSETRGRTWAHIADEIRARTKIDVAAAEIAAALLAAWNAAATDVQAIPGAPQAIRAAAARRLKLGVVSSSPRSVIDLFLDKLGISDCIGDRARIGGDAVRATKPDPEGYLLAAQALDVDPLDSVVFEDSRAGLLAARAAGMRTIFVTCCAAEIVENTALATAVCTHYRTLPPRFWDELAAGTLDLTDRSYT